MSSTIEALARIGLNLASVEQFLSIACGLADDNPDIRSGVYEATKETRSSALLVDHLRNLFGHQESIEAQQHHHHHQYVIETNCYSSQASKQFQENARLFTYSNQLTLVRAAKCLVANVAKILYLTDSVLLHTDGLGYPDEGLDNNKFPSSSTQRLDNVANYSQLLRSFSELAGELVDLGHCLMLACLPRGNRLQQQQQRLAKQQLDGENGGQQRVAIRQSASSDSLPQLQQVGYTQFTRRPLAPLGENMELVAETHQVPATQLDEEEPFRNSLAEIEMPSLDSSLNNTKLTSQLDAQLQDMQILFQVNRSILLLLSTSKCCLRAGSELEKAAEARRSIVVQIRASVSIIMAIVKCSVFGASLERQQNQDLHQQKLRMQLESEDNQLGDWRNCLYDWQALAEGDKKRVGISQVLRTETNLKSGWRGEEEALTASTEAASAGPSLQIMNYFLLTWNGTQSAHDSINKLQLLVKPFELAANYKCFMRALDETFTRSQQETCANILEDLTSTTTTSEEMDKENRKLQQQRSNISSASVNLVMLMNKRQLISTLNRIFLTDARSNIVERAQEFTDCAYTRHEHRETILLLVHCIKLLLGKLVKLIYRLRRKSSTINELNLGQLRHLAQQLGETCEELKFELQTVVIEQSDELDRCNTQTDLIKQLKHYCLLGDTVKSETSCLEFREQSEQLVELCKMLNQVAPTNKMKITTKAHAIWFQLNLVPLLATAQTFATNPRSRVLKDSTWAYMQVWCSFYDDFCQMARQIAYLTHAQFDSARSQRISLLRDQVLMRHRQLNAASMLLANEQLNSAPYDFSSSSELSSGLLGGFDGGGGIQCSSTKSELLNHYQPIGSLLKQTTTDPTTDFARLTPQPGPSGQLVHACSVQSLNLPDTLSDNTDSPRSLDHYHGFGANYHRQVSRLAHHQQHHHHHQSSLAEEHEQYPLLACCTNEEPRGDEQFASMMMESGAATGYLPADYAPITSRLPGHSYNSYQATQQQHQHQQQQQPRFGQRAKFEAARQYEHLRGESVAQVLSCDQQEVVRPPIPPSRRLVSLNEQPSMIMGRRDFSSSSSRQPNDVELRQSRQLTKSCNRQSFLGPVNNPPTVDNLSTNEDSVEESAVAISNVDQQSIATTEPDKWSDSEADAIVRGARETAQMAMSMYQFTKGEGDLNTTQDLFTQAELFAEEANELYKEVRCFSYKVPAGELKKELLAQLSSIPALVQQLQFIVKNPTVGKPATFAKVDSVIRETRSLMEAVNRVVTATLSCRQHYNMAIASMRKRTRTLSPNYRGDKGLEFENHSSVRQSALGGRHGAGGGGMGSEPDI